MTVYGKEFTIIKCILLQRFAIINFPLDSREKIAACQDMQTQTLEAPEPQVPSTPEQPPFKLG